VAGFKPAAVFDIQKAGESLARKTFFGPRYAFAPAACNCPHIQNG
jgi:hypothetical protein